MKLKTIKMNGMHCEIDVSGDGRFSCNVAGQWCMANTLEELKVKLKKATKRPNIQVAIPMSVTGRKFHRPQYGRASWVSGYGAQHITLTSIGVDGDVRYQDDLTHEKGDLDDVTGHHRGELTRRLTDEEVAEYARLAEAADDAREALHEFLKPLTVTSYTAADLVKAAIAAKEDAPEEPPEEPADPRVLPMPNRKKNA